MTGYADPATAATTHARFRRSSGRLADGREIHYYDWPGAPIRNGTDRRRMEARPAPSQLRHDPLLDEWVVIAAHRQTRTHLPQSDDCPLCPSSGPDGEIPAADYDVVVFDNRFPALSQSTSPAGPAGAGAAAVRGGHCEVICFASDHTVQFADLPIERVRLIIEAWCDRSRALASRPGVRQVTAFENRGKDIGVTLTHPHGQLYAYPFLPPHTRRHMIAARDYQRRTGRDLAADILAAELAGPRMLLATWRWAAYVPQAARWPFEIHLRPRRPRLTLPDLDPDERDELAVLYPQLLRALEAVYGLPMPYIATWHQAPLGEVTSGVRDLMPLYLQVFSIRRSPTKLKYLAASESTMGAFINDITPEHAATLLATALPDRPTSGG